MNVLFYGIGLVSVAFFAHLLLWKLYLPKNQTKALLYIFSAVYIAGVFIFFMPLSASQAPFFLQLSFLFISLTLAYIVSYTAIEVDSPSLAMVFKIARAGSAGLGKGALGQADSLVTERVEDLAKGSFIDCSGGFYKINPRGAFIARIFIIYRKLLKAGKGG